MTDLTFKTANRTTRFNEQHVGSASHQWANRLPSFSASCRQSRWQHLIPNQLNYRTRSNLQHCQGARLFPMLPINQCLWTFIRAWVLPLMASRKQDGGASTPRAVTCLLGSHDQRQTWRSGAREEFLWQYTQDSTSVDTGTNYNHSPS